MAPKQSAEFNGTDAARDARGFVGARLLDRGIGHECGPVLLAVSELVTNAIVHGQGPISVDVALRSGVVRVEVCDQGGGVAAIRPTHATGDRIGGWGLRMVDSIADRWGSHHLDATRTVVWFERTINPDAN